MRPSAGMDSPAEAELVLEIDDSPAVRRYIRAQGGRLFLWLEDVGGPWAIAKVSTSAPSGGREFDEYDAEGFTLYVESDFEPPYVKLRLRRWWPFAPISVWTGAETGWRLARYRRDSGAYT